MKYKSNPIPQILKKEMIKYKETEKWEDPVLLISQTFTHAHRYVCVCVCVLLSNSFSSHLLSVRVWSIAKEAIMPIQLYDWTLFYD